MQFLIEPGGALTGTLRVPGDKSVSHRAIMLGALADGESTISGFLEGEDALATLKAFRQMGVDISQPSDGAVRIRGVGLHGLRAPGSELDLGNSGTSIRLMAGLLAGQAFSTTLVGDASLSKRPMNRVALPLREMGARIGTSPEGTPPIRLEAGEQLNGIEYRLPVASAQIKSCLLLAGLYAAGTTSVIEPAPTRDHTERMLQAMDYPVQVAALPGESGATRISLQGGSSLRPGHFQVPADISSAAFFMVAASIVPGSDLLLTDVGVNPTRTGVITALQSMGASLELSNERMFGGEPVADIRVRYAPLHGVEFDEQLVPLAIDEFPVLFIAACAAEGRTILRGAKELRVKESDRIATMAEGIQRLGGKAQPTEDGMIIDGQTLSGGQVDSYLDHRIAMAFSVAGMVASGEVRISGCDHVATSFPGFAVLSAARGMRIREVQ